MLSENTIKSAKRRAPASYSGAKKRAKGTTSQPVVIESKYWVELQDRYPNLSKLALDVLSIPALSCECERLFSELRRRGISPELLAAIQCNRRWIRAGFGGGQEVDGGPTDEQLGAKYGMDTWDSH